MVDQLQGSEEFIRLAGRYRPELLAHCYRMLGSVDDAEDLVQETYLRAWRGYGGFEGRPSLRARLYPVAPPARPTTPGHPRPRVPPPPPGAPRPDPPPPPG